MNHVIICYKAELFFENGGYVSKVFDDLEKARKMISTVYVYGVNVLQKGIIKTAIVNGSIVADEVLECA